MISIDRSERVRDPDSALALARELAPEIRVNGVAPGLIETGMTQLGGHAIFLDADKTQVSHGESPKDMGIILGRYGDVPDDLAPYTSD